MSAPVAAPARNCPLCGYRFEQGVARCGSCPLHAGCGTTACPRCGYELFERSVTADAIVRIGRRLRSWLSPAPGPGGPS